MKYAIVIPAYNEATRLSTVLHEMVDGGVDTSCVFVVDDGSTDDTMSVASETGVHVLRHVVNRGQGAALRTGTRAALEWGAEAIVHMDADGQHRLEDVQAMIEALRTGNAVFVFGSRFLGVEPQGMPFARRLVLSAARLFSVYALGIPRRMTDPQSGMRGFTRDQAHHVVHVQDGMAHCSEILRNVTQSDAQWCEIPIQVVYTQDSLAKGQRASAAFKIAWDVLTRRFL